MQICSGCIFVLAAFLRMTLLFCRLLEFRYYPFPEVADGFFSCGRLCVQVIVDLESRKVPKWGD